MNANATARGLAAEDGDWEPMATQAGTEDEARAALLRWAEQQEA